MSDEPQRGAEPRVLDTAITRWRSTTVHWKRVDLDERRRCDACGRMVNDCWVSNLETALCHRCWESAP